jgi:flagellar M-ring protein FliF
MAKTSDALKTTLSGFTAGQKAMTVLAVIAVLLGAVVFTSWATKPSLVPVFTNLESSDAAAITEELTTRGTQYELAEGGTTVLVPQADVYQLRLDLSAAGLPEGGEAGYELLDEQGITTSEFRQRVDYQRALEGELAKTISSIDGVAAATVHLVIPEESLFSEDGRTPSASVLIKDEVGKGMTDGQVQAVVNLVAASVEGLDHERVTVADAKGRVLSGDGQDAAGTLSDARVTQTATFEKALQGSVEQMLTPLVGSGKAVVRVSADLDFDKRETTTESFETDKQAPLVTEKTGGEDYTGTGAVVGGVLGPENVVQENGGESTYKKAEGERTFAVGKTTEQAVSAPGAVKRLSVAVVLDAGADPQITTAAVQQLVSAAAGLDPARGDVVEVSRLAFDTTAATAAEEEFAALEAAERSAQRWALGRTVGIMLLVGLMVLYALRVMRRDRRTEIDPSTLELEAMQLQAIDLEEAAMLEAAQQLALEAAVTPEEARRVAVQAEVSELVERQPDEVAKLLRGWLADRRS